jgi:hypothetical protein
LCIPVRAYRGLLAVSCTKSGLFGQAQTLVQVEYVDADTRPQSFLKLENRFPQKAGREEKFAVRCRDVCGNRCAQISLRKSLGEGGTMKTWFELYQERRAVTQKKQQSTLTAEQIGRYAHEVRREIQDLIQVRRRERLAEEENAGFLEVTGEQAMADQDIKWPPGSDRHPFQRVAALSLKIAGRNQGLRFRLLKLFCEEAERGTCAAAIYEAVWDTISNLADDVLDEAIGVVYEEPKTKAASAA